MEPDMRQCNGLTRSPSYSQKEGQEDQATLKQLGGSPSLFYLSWPSWPSFWVFPGLPINQSHCLELISSQFATFAKTSSWDSGAFWGGKTLIRNQARPPERAECTKNTPNPSLMGLATKSNTKLLRARSHALIYQCSAGGNPRESEGITHSTLAL